MLGRLSLRLSLGRLSRGEGFQGPPRSCSLIDPLDAYDKKIQNFYLRNAY